MTGHDWKSDPGWVRRRARRLRDDRRGWGVGTRGGEKPGLASEGPPGQKGSWFVPPLPALKDRLQAIHTVLLPNGKVLMVNGSSNRNRIEKNGTIQDGVSSKDYNVVNNTALFDPSAPANSSGVERIGSPQTPSSDGANLDSQRRAERPVLRGPHPPVQRERPVHGGHGTFLRRRACSSARGWRGSSTGRPRAGSQPAE